jgi:two-component system nitrogen regulation response regulator GlnG
MITVIFAEDQKKIKEIVDKMLQTEGYAVTEEREGQLYRSVLDKVEKQLLEYVLERTEGNQLKSARILGINRNTLRSKVKSLGIEAGKWKKATH